MDASFSLRTINPGSVLIQGGFLEGGDLLKTTELLLTDNDVTESSYFNYPDNFEDLISLYNTLVDTGTMVEIGFENGIVNSIGYDPLINSIGTKFGKQGRVIFPGTNVGKREWYYLADLIMLDHLTKISNPEALHKLFFKTIIKYILRTLINPTARSAWDRCLNFVRAQCFTNHPELFMAWKIRLDKIINNQTRERSSYILSTLEGFKNSVCSKIDPYSYSYLNGSTKEFLNQHIKSSNLSLEELLYHFWSSGKVLSESILTVEDLYGSFPNQSKNLDRYFLVSTDKYKTFKEGMAEIYSRFITKTPLFLAFGDCDFQTEIVPYVKLIFKYLCCLRYLNDGRSLDGNMFGVIQAIQNKEAEEFNVIFRFPEELVDIHKIYTWADTVRTFWSTRFPHLSEYVHLPVFTLVRETLPENPTEVFISGEIKFEDDLHQEKIWRRGLSVTPNVALTNDF